jgi:uncharacterized SAM-binding protein YcdF (DUF218 family)
MSWFMAKPNAIQVRLSREAFIRKASSMFLSSLVWSCARPSSLLLGLFAVGLVLSLAGRQRSARLVMGGTAAILLAIAVLPSGDWAMATLEDRYSRQREWPDHIDGIIGLGGAVIPSLTSIWHTPALTDGAERMTAFVAAARHYPEARLVFTGGTGSTDPAGLREADVAAMLFEQLGLPRERILFERYALNTRDNATLTWQMIQPKPGERWLLVTSAFHMPRAEGAFTRAGWQVIPWPTGFKSGRSSGTPGIDLPLDLTLLDYAFHEWAGMLVYRARGWI